MSVYHVRINIETHSVAHESTNIMGLASRGEVYGEQLMPTAIANKEMIATATTQPTEND